MSEISSPNFMGFSRDFPIYFFFHRIYKESSLDNVFRGNNPTYPNVIKPFPI